MQNNIVKAFRQRLVRNGYSDISIRRASAVFVKEMYTVRACCPNGKYIVQYMSITKMRSLSSL